MNSDVAHHSLLEKRWLRRLLWVVSGVLVLWVVSWLVVPPVLKWQAQSHLSALLGRQVTVGEVDFKPWSLELSVRDVVVARAAPAEQPGGASANASKLAMAPQFTLRRLYIDTELQSLLRLAPVVDAVVVDSPHLSVKHIGQGHYDVDDILARLASKPPDPGEPASKALRFALYNLMLSDGLVELTDVPKDTVHTLSQLKLNLPFLSNLDGKRDILVQPALAFNLNGSQFDSTANTTPFTQTRKTDAQLLIKDLDLAPYLAYLPASLPVRLGSAVLDADIKLVFEQTDKPAVTLSGLVSASRVQISAAQADAVKPPASAELLAFDRLSVQLKNVQPLLRQVALGQVTWTQPHLHLQRNRAGLINVLALSTPRVPSDATKNKADSALPVRAGAEKGLKSAATATDTAASAATATVAAADASAWQASVDSIVLQGGEVTWLDQVPTQPAQLELTALNLHASALAWPFSQPMPFEGSAQLAGAALQFKGSATDQAAEVSAQLTGWPLSVAQPYLADVLVPQLEGSVTADLGVRWAAAQGSQAAQTAIQVKSLSLDKLALRAGKMQALVQGEKRRNQPSAEGQASATSSVASALAAVKVSPEEYPALLKTVYKRADFPKPRNVIGLTKDVPVPEMEALLLTHLDASEAATQALAVKRGVVVRDYLASLKLPSDRLFLGAAKAVAPEAKWRPRAELNLATE